MNATTLKQLVNNQVQYRYIHSDHKCRRVVRAYNLGETTHAESEQIARFIKKVNAHTTDVAVACYASTEGIEVKRKKVADCAWLATYLKRYYATPKQDGTTNIDYMIHRSDRLLGATEMKRSWKTKVD